NQVDWSTAAWEIAWRADNDTDPISGEGTVSFKRGAGAAQDVAFDVTDFSVAFYSYDNGTKLWTRQTQATPNSATGELRLEFTLTKIIRPQGGGYDTHEQNRVIYVALRNPTD